MNQLRKALGLLSHLPKVLRLVWQAAGAVTAAWLLLLFLQGLLPGVSVYLTKLVLDGAGAALGQGTSWDTMRLFLIPAALLGGTMLLAQVLSAVQKYVQAAQAERLQDYVQGLVQAKALELDFSFFDASESYDRLERASGEGGSRTQEMLSNVGGLLQTAVSLVGIGAVLLPYGLWLPIVLLVGAAPALGVVVRHNKAYHRWWKRTTPDRRRVHYYNYLLTFYLSAAEMRLLGLGARYKSAYAALRQRLRGERLELIKRQGLGNVGAGLISLMVTGAVMGWVIWRALRGDASLGDLGLFYRAFNEGQGLLRTLLSNAGRTLTSILFLEHLFEFLEMRPSITSPAQPRRAPDALRDGIRFDDVTFRYHGTDRPALEGFSLHIPAEQVTAIVGPNGAGKSTLTKLLCRLYDPNEGAVTFDGVDIRSYDVEEVRRRVTIMFQEPFHYQATAADNIAVGDVRAEPTEARLAAAADGALIHDTLAALPEGYDTQLGRYFGQGVELSGGQWQRVSLARAFYRQSPVVVLDEPTSAMDSWAEHAWLQRFGQLVEGRTTLIITHRFTTAMHADVIHVMVDGEVIESGTHDELLALDGYYAESWRAQVERGWRPQEPAGDGAPEMSSEASPAGHSTASGEVGLYEQSDGV
jgi:ATP-binding cassette subfamily B protein